MTTYIEQTKQKELVESEFVALENIDVFDGFDSFHTSFYLKMILDDDQVEAP